MLVRCAVVFTLWAVLAVEDVFRREIKPIDDMRGTDACVDRLHEVLHCVRWAIECIDKVMSGMYILSGHGRSSRRKGVTLTYLA